MIIILIDTREQNGTYIRKRIEASGIETEIVTFPQETGTDYLIANTKGSCAVQRKVVYPEFIAELDEILHDIAPRLISYSDNPCFLIEENYTITEDGYISDRNRGCASDMKATSYFGVLETLRRMGCDVYTTRDLNASIWWMVAMHNYLGKYHFPKHRKYFSVEEQAAGMLMCVPGIGEVRAGKALEQNSIRNMAMLKKIPGLTEKQSTGLGKALRYKVKQ